MDQDTRKKITELTDRIIDVVERVARLKETSEHPIEDAKAASRMVSDVSATYRRLLDGASDADRAAIERRVGRKVMGLRQQAGFLPKMSAGSPVKTSVGNGWENPYESGTGNNAGAPQWVAQLDGPREVGELRVGRDVDAWCGACDMLRAHTIAAMVEDRPKQVICNTCGARHNYRVSPARKRKTSASDAESGGGDTSALQAQHQSKRARQAEKERTALQKELAAATEVRPFALRARYKVGEIIDHAEHGRGKVENVLRTRVLVRFRSGLKSLATR